MFQQTILKLSKLISNTQHPTQELLKIEQDKDLSKASLAKMKNHLNQKIKATDDAIMEFQVQLDKVTDFIRFKQSFALDLYKNIANFYKQVPENQFEAKEILQQKIEETKATIARIEASEDRNKTFMLHIFKKEILINLQKMESYHEGQWKELLNTNKKMWQNITNQTAFLAMEYTIVKVIHQKIQIALAKRTDLKNEISKIRTNLAHIK